MDNDKCNDCKVAQALMAILNCPACQGTGIMPLESMRQALSNFGMGTPTNERCQCLTDAQVIINS